MLTWEVWTEGSTIYTRWGQEGGSKQIATITAEPKNVGRSNQTTAEQQAELEADSMWKYQVERKYRESRKEAQETVYLPMLARSEAFKFDKEKKHHYPADIQLKLDGVRALAFWDNGKVILISRNGKEYNVPHISKALAKVLPEDDMLDGELYCHGVSFETVISWCKRFQPDTMRIEYRIYDYPICNGNEDEVWVVRKEYLLDFHKRCEDKDKIVLVETKTVTTHDEVRAFEADAIAQGYEGAILRQHFGKYLFGNRSRYELLKVKSFVDEEFEVTGYKTGTPGTKEENAIIWCCKTKEDKPFDARPRGSIAKREELFKNDPDQHIGKMYKVKFFEYTAEGKPRFPVGLGFRDPDDM
jgi:ATP-dependent DNA ligase